MNASLAPLIRKTGFRYGIVLGAVLSALFFIFVLLEISDGSRDFVSLSLAFTAVFIYLAHLYFKKNGDGTMTFRQGVTISFWMGLASGILASIITYIYIKFIHGIYTDKQLDAANIDFRGAILLDAYDTLRGFLFLRQFICAIFVGLVVSLIAKKAPSASKTMNASLAPLIRKTGVRYGIMLGLVSSVSFLAIALLKINSDSWMFMLPVPIFAIALIYLAHLYFKENNNGTMTFEQGATISFWVGLASGILSSVITYIYVKFINTAYMYTDIADSARIDLEKRGLPDDQIDAILDTMKQVMIAERMVFSTIFGAIASAVLIGLVISIFTKKAPAATL